MPVVFQLSQPTWQICLVRKWWGRFAGDFLPLGQLRVFFGPVVVNYKRDFQLSLVLPREQVYKQTIYILVGMLVVGLICNLMVKPVDQKYLMTAEELANEKKLAHERSSSSEVGSSLGQFEAHNPIWAWLAWSVVGIALAWGVYRTGLSVVKFFG
jgi:hypothetical protein